MRTRPLEESDKEVLDRLADQTGFSYPNLDDPLIEAVEIVVDSEGIPIMAAVAKRLVETYLYVSPGQSPAVQIEALALLHESLAQRLRELRYNSCEAFLPESVSKKFGRRLERTFGWIRNPLASWTKHF